MWRVCLLFSVVWWAVAAKLPPRSAPPRDMTKAAPGKVVYVYPTSDLYFFDPETADRNFQKACTKSGGYFYSTNWPTGELRRVCAFSDGSSVQEL